jgi:hypothetical protein
VGPENFFILREEEMMNAKYAVVGALVGGIVLFIWGFISHAVLPIEKYALHEFKDPKQVTEVIRANGQGNGMYYTKEGILTVVALTPDMRDRTEHMTPMLVREFISSVLAALLLAWLVVKSKSRSTLGRAAFLAMAGLTAVVGILVSYSTWYGFPAITLLADAIDTIGGWFIAGLVLSPLANKLAPPTA